MSSKEYTVENIVSPQVRLSVWAPCRWEKTYFDIEHKRPAEASEFQECLYSWALNVDPKMGLTEEEIQKYDNLVGEKFNVQKGVEARSVNELKELIDYLMSLYDKYNQQYIPYGLISVNETPKEINIHALLALAHQLRWVYETFLATPNSSITFR